MALTVFSGCRDEKELTVIDKNTPVSVSALYMYGNANYTDWDYDNPTPLKKEGAFVYTFHGPLRQGQFKLGTSVGNNYQAFIQPKTDGEIIGEEAVEAKDFCRPQYGAKERLWKIDKDGVYKLEFNIQTLKYNAVYEGLLDSWDSPIESNSVFVVGTSIDVAWNLENAEQMMRDSKNSYLFTWTGNLMPGSLRFALNNVSWDYPGLHPETDGVPVGKDNTLSNEAFRFTDNIANNWEIKDRGNYTITVNLHDLTMSAKYNGECSQQPIDHNVRVYLFGDATQAGWELGAGIPLEPVESSDYVFSVQTKLYPGWMLFMLDNDSWDRQIRPNVADSPIGATPVFENFVYPNTNNTNWLVQFAGDYRLTVDLRNCTLSTEYIIPDGSMVFVYGDASAASWDLGQGLPMTPVAGAEQTFVWEGALQPGWLVFSLDNESWDKMIRPVVADTPITPDAVLEDTFIYPTKENSNWLVTTHGNYRLTVDVANRTLKAEYLRPKADKIYIYGDASAAGWDLPKGLEMLPVSGKEQVFEWEGHLKPGWMIFSLMNNGWDKMIRPTSPDLPIGTNPVTDQKFSYPSNENNNWLVTTDGTYRLTIDWQNGTLSATLISQN